MTTPGCFLAAQLFPAFPDSPGCSWLLLVAPASRCALPSDSGCSLMSCFKFPLLVHWIFLCASVFVFCVSGSLVFVFWDAVGNSLRSSAIYVTPLVIKFVLFNIIICILLLFFSVECSLDAVWSNDTSVNFHAKRWCLHVI